MNVAEEIEINLDPSNALRGIDQLIKGVEQLGASAGVPSKALNQMLNGMERGYATAAAAQARATMGAASGAREATRAVGAQIKAQQELARATEQAQKKLGLRTNAAGQTIDAGSGQFASAARIQQLQQEIGNQQKLISGEAILQKSRMQNERIADSSRRTLAGVARQEEASYKTRQAELNKTFKALDRGGVIANTVRTRLGDIPPVRMVKGLNSAVNGFMEMGNSARYALYDVSATFGIAGAAIAGIGVAAIAAAVSHERAFANVERTTVTTAAGYETLKRQLEQMSMTLPVTFEELSNIATAAGQLGISASGVASFTSTVAKLTATTNLTSDAAGVALARFRAFFSEADKSGMEVTEATFSNLASSILKVGVNSIATESGIVNVAIQIASMGDYAGMTANQVIGLAGAMSSIGVAPELSRGTITRTFSNIGNAVSEGGVQLEKFAALAGMTSGQFKASWGTDQFAGTFTRLISGIKGISDSGQDANLVLQQLGFNSVRDRPLLLRLAEAADDLGNSGGLLGQTMRDAAEGWTSNSELTVQYAKIATTTSARLQVLGQSFEQLAASMGEQSGGMLGDIALQMTNVVKNFEEFSNSDFGKDLGSVAVGATLIVGGLMLLVAAGSRTIASLQGVGFAFKMMTNSGVSGMSRLSAAFRVASLSLGIIGLIATVVSLGVAWKAMSDAAQDSKRGLQDTAGLVQAMQTDAENGSSGLVIWGEVIGDAGRASAAADKPLRDAADALHGTGKAGRDSSSGVDSASNSMRRAKFVFGDAAKEFMKAQIAQSDAFKDLFGERKNFFGQSTDSLGISAIDIDYQGAIDSAIRGDDMVKYFQDQVAAKLKVGKYEDIQFKPGVTMGELQELDRLVADSAAVFQGTRSEIEKNISAISAFGSEGKKSLSEISTSGATAAEMMAELDEVTQKTVDATAQGFGKFVDVSKLIDLTQKSLDTSEEGIESYKKAWEDAYGGASFSLEQYLSNFRRAGEEQQQFITNLQTLGASGRIAPEIIADLSAMGPEANRLVQAMVDDLNATGGEGLAEFTDLWGRTGYDSMVAFAVQAALGQAVIRNIMYANGEAGGIEMLRAFNDKLASGMGVEAALAELQLDVNGKPIVPAIAKPPMPPGLTAWEKQQWANNNRLHTTGTVSIAVPILDGAGMKVGTKTVTPGWAMGGYTGNGGKYQEAGTVHKGEFVMTKEATRAIGVGNLYAMMNAAQGGRAAPRGRGYAQGGSVTGGAAMSTVIAYLSPEDRELLRSIQPVVRIGDRDIARAQAGANFRTTRGGV